VEDMTKDELISWCDKIVDAIEILRGMENGVDAIKICKLDASFHIYSGIFYMSEVLGVPLKREWIGGDSYQLRISFIYRGVKFFELCTVKDNFNIENVKIVYKDREKLPMDDVDEKPEGIFADMNKVVQDFDEATKNIHAELGSLGVVE
jgi:hypothetical protein